MKSPFQRTITPEARPWLGSTIGIVSLLWLCALVCFVSSHPTDGLPVLLWALLFVLSLSLTMYAFSMFCPGGRQKARLRLARMIKDKPRPPTPHEKEAAEWEAYLAECQKAHEEELNDIYTSMGGKRPSLVIDTNRPGLIPLTTYMALVYEAEKKVFLDGEPYDFSQIMQARLSVRTERERTYTTTTDETDNADMIGRAAIGHAIWGNVGAVVGAVTANRRANTYTTGGGITHNYTLSIAVDSLETPTFTLDFGEDEEAARKSRDAFKVIIRRGKEK